jgi:hypothetical protein
MEPQHWIAIGAALVSLVAVVVQQFRILQADRRTQRRTANKLKILYLCQSEALTEDQIFRKYREQHPTEGIDEVEIRKTIYEMLCDETLLYSAKGRTYEVRSFTTLHKSNP